MTIPKNETEDDDKSKAFLNAQELISTSRGWMAFCFDQEGNVIPCSDMNEMSDDQVRAFFHLVENYKLNEVWKNWSVDANEDIEDDD